MLDADDPDVVPSSVTDHQAAAGSPDSQKTTGYFGGVKMTDIDRFEPFSGRVPDLGLAVYPMIGVTVKGYDPLGSTNAMESAEAVSSDPFRATDQLVPLGRPDSVKVTTAVWRNVTLTQTFRGPRVSLPLRGLAR
jgi:hypothetical protein